MPQGTEIQCSGCKFPGSGGAYVCWQCSYFLHEKCFHASRSLKHPSHTAHPLTLVPYPTYPSNSFYCNICNLAGSGFSYCCSECDFDLHVHCAFVPNPTPGIENSSTTLPYPNSGYGGAHNFNPQPASPAHPTATAAYPYHDIQTTNFPPNYPPSTHHNTSLNPPPNNSFVPQSYPGSIQHNPSLNPMPSSPPMPNNYPESIQHNTTSPRPSPITTPAMPTGYPESIQHNATVNPQPNSPMPSYNNSSASVAGTPTNQTKPPEVSPSLPQVSEPVRISLLSIASKVKEVKHFSHPHALLLNKIKDAAPKVCSGCEDNLTGSAYSCIDPLCNFNLHKSCFELPQEISHKSHLDHPLKLLVKPPSHYTDNQYACNACLQPGAAFVYNCEKCSFDLHVECVSLPESIIRPDHKHPLKLFYANPVPKAEEPKEVTFICDVCQKPVHEMAWTYYCHECDFGTHLECVAYEIQPAQKTEEELVREAELKLAMLNLLINGGLNAVSLTRT